MEAAGHSLNHSLSPSPLILLATMKLQLLTLSVSAVLSTLLCSTVASAATAPPSTVYFFSHGHPSTTRQYLNNDDDMVPRLNLQETRATLAHLLNLGQGSQDEFVDMQGPIQKVFNQPGMSRKDLFETMGGNLMMVIEGVQEPKDLMSSFDPSFIIDNTQGIQDLVTDLASSVPSEDRYLFNTHQSSESGDALVNEHLVAEHHANVDVSVFDLSKKADALFLEESVSLGNYIDSYEKKHNKNGGADFIRITIKGLAALTAEHGEDSVQVQTAKQILKEFLQQTFIPEFEQIHKTYTTTIILVGPTTRQGSELFSEAQVSPLVRHSMKRALPAAGTCFATAKDCEADTNGCSQRGACVFSAAANCYHCKCARIENTQYSGPTCNKIDLSIQFHLFFWLVLGLVLMVALAVGLILQMGNQSQGGVPIGPTRAQLKRD